MFADVRACVCVSAHVRICLLYVMALHSCTIDKEINGRKSEVDPILNSLLLSVNLNVSSVIYIFKKYFFGF